MKFLFKVSSKARKQLRKFSKITRKRIIDGLKDVAKTGKGIESLVNFKYGYKIRIGNYRALVDVDFKKNLVVVKKVGHRSKIYRKK